VLWWQPTRCLSDNTGLREFLITGDASTSLAVVAFVAQFILTLVAYGSGAPGGYSLSLILGSALGYLVRRRVQLNGTGSPATYPGGNGGVLAWFPRCQSRDRHRV